MGFNLIRADSDPRPSTTISAQQYPPRVRRCGGRDPANASVLSKQLLPAIRLTITRQRLHVDNLEGILAWYTKHSPHSPYNGLVEGPRWAVCRRCLVRLEVVGE